MTVKEMGLAVATRRALIASGLGRMSRTSTRVVDYQTLSNRGKSATVVVKLMMACNDLQLANEALFSWRGEQPRNRRYRQQGALMYFVRLQMAHLYEALKIIAEIRKDSDLMTWVSACDEQTKASFHKLEAFVAGGAKHRRFQQLVGRVRHSLTFHYDESGKLISKMIEDRASRPDARHSTITRGSTAYLWHFPIADEIADSIVVREVWGIERDKDVRAEIDKILAEMHDIFLAFVDFSGEFVWRFCGR